MSINPRKIAMKILLDINLNKAYSNIQLNKYLKNVKDSRDKNFVREIVYGILENKIYIDYIISKASKIKLRKIHPNVLEILRIGVYQISFMDKIPESAAVNESVKLTKKYSHKGTVGYVNGVLRSIARKKEAYMSIDADNRIEYISILYSHPKDMVKKWVDDFGIEFTEKLCEANNKKPPFNIRVNTLKISKSDLKDALRKKQISSKDGKYAKDSLTIENPKDMTNIGEYKNGLFTIQDESSSLVAQILNPLNNSKAIDLCSAPGGKSTHIAQLMNNKGYILSRDIHKHKINLIKQATQRLGIDIIYAKIGDALEKDNKLINQFDYCLLDAPCSGTGVIRRKPEIKWSRNHEGIKSLSKLQYKMLVNAGEYLKPGGILVYSTCSIEKEENILVVEEFLKKHHDFEFVSIDKDIENQTELDTLKEGYLQLYPHMHGTDGFFIAKMVKKDR